MCNDIFLCWHKWFCTDHRHTSLLVWCNFAILIHACHLAADSLLIIAHLKHCNLLHFVYHHTLTFLSPSRKTPECYSSLFPTTAKFWDMLSAEVFPKTHNLQIFKYNDRAESVDICLCLQTSSILILDSMPSLVHKTLWWWLCRLLPVSRETTRHWDPQHSCQVVIGQRMWINV